MPKETVIAYVRQSVARPGESASESLSLQSQLDAIRRYCAEQGWTIAHEIRDHDQSGTNWNRPGMMDLMSAVEAGGIDRVVVYKLSRFARDVFYQELTHRELKARGVSLVSVSEPGADRTLVRLVMGAVNQHHNEDVSDWLKDMVKGRATRGLHHGRPPYGYVIPSGTNRRTRRMEVQPEQAEVVRRIYEMRLSGLGALAIANRLNEEGIRSQRGNAWGKASIGQILRNPAYAGYAVYNGEIVGDADPVNTPALIDRGVWHQVQAMRGVSAPRADREPISWLQGIAYHACGKRLWAVGTYRHTRGSMVQPFFRCASHSEARAEHCAVRPIDVRARALEQAAIRCIETDIAQAPATADEAISRYLNMIGRSDSRTKLAELERKRDHLRASIKRAEDMVVDGLRDARWFKEKDAELQILLRDVNVDIARFVDLPQASEVEASLNHLHSLTGDFSLVPDERKFAFIAALGKVVLGDTVSVEYADQFRILIPEPTRVLYRYSKSTRDYERRQVFADDVLG